MHLLYRKLYRSSSFLFVLLLIFTSKKNTLLFLGITLSLLFLIEYIRFNNEKINEKIFSLFSPILKPKEKRKISSTTIYFISMFVTVLIFPKKIAIASLCFLIFPDILSAIVGYYWGKIKLIKEKTLEGSLAFFFTCLFIGIILKYFNFSFNWKAIFASAFFASMVELFPYIDDNISVPFVTGFILSILK
jgi:glycerol-3-phosphate acyltransferase PlsY